MLRIILKFKFRVFFPIKTLRFITTGRRKKQTKSYFLVEKNSVVCDEVSTDGDEGIWRVSSPKFSSPLVLSVESK